MNPSIYPRSNDIPESQKAIQSRSIHPTGTFIEFNRDELERSIPHRFRNQVARFPNRLAVADKRQRLSYEELDRMTNRAAQAILDRQSAPGQPVAFLMEQGVPSVIAILGILKAGDFYVPLDPTYPYDRIAYMLADSTARIIITNRRNYPLAKQLSSDACHIISIDDLSSTDSCSPPELSNSRDRLAYIMYTSGSTGRPKGVMDTHRNVLHQTLRYTEHCHICCEDRLSHLRSCSFNGAVKDVFGALLNGAAIFSFDLKEEGGEGLSDWLLQEQVTIYCSVATVYRQFVNSLTKRKQFPQLRHIYIGGEPIYSSDIELFQRHFSRSCVFSASLGTTETGGAVRRYVIDSTTPFEGTVVPIGYPVTDMEIVLLDDDGQPQESEEGEIGVRSEFISPGYWRLSELTARAFLPDPEGGALRIYRTGDMGRMLPDGCLIHIGRKDAQVKIRGQRVEIGEVETALLNLPDVREAAVVVRDDSTGANRLVAYFVPTSSSGPNVSELRRRLSQTLPDSMMPSAFVKMDRLPRTPAEKVNRNSLPEPGRERPELETAFVGARTPIEEKLTEIWSSVLCIEPVGVYDRFLDLGGHSLIAGRIAARVIDAFQVTLPFRSLFEAPTIAEMAVRISQAQVLEAGQEEIQHILDGLDSS